MFKYFEESTHQNKTAKNKQNYFESVQRLDAILDVFEILRLDCGQNLDD